MREEKKREHESYATIQISRVSGGNPRLFGSPLPSHDQTFVITISQATEHIDEDGESRIWGGQRKQHLSVRMSAAQFTALITTMNIGSGVPCTLTRLGGRRIEDPPDVPSEVEEIISRANDEHSWHSKKIRADFKRALDICEEMLAGKTLKKSDLRRLASSLYLADKVLWAELPFSMAMIRKSMEKVRAHALAEIEAAAMGMIQRAGLGVLLGKKVQIVDADAPDLIEVHDEL